MDLHGLSDADLPGLFEAADQTSLTGQTQYLRAARSRLALGVLAAAASLWTVHLGDLDYLALLAAVAFLGALGIEMWLLAEKPEDKWYDGRALAESSKTLAWRFAIGAEPFPVSLVDARERLLAQLDGLLRDAPHTGIVPTDRPAVTEAMTNLRSAPLEVRRNAYLQARIEDQRCWYGRKSHSNGRMADRWARFLIVVEICGVGTALGRAVGWYDLDLASLGAALMGALSAWIGVKQFRSLQRAYAYANHELGIVKARLSRPMTEAEWASEAADSEEAISREHTMWRASRATLGMI